MDRSRSLPDRSRLLALLDGLAAPVGAPPPDRTRVAMGGPVVRDGADRAQRPSIPYEPASRPEERFEEGQPATRRLRMLLDAAPSLERRLDALVEWLVGETGAVAVFVTDQDGLPIANRNAQEAQMAAASHMAYAQRKAGRYVTREREATTALRLEDGQTLQLVTTPTWAGELTLGLVLAKPIGLGAAAGLARLVDETVADGVGRGA